ncbi:MAG: transglycosylase, family [Nocardioides sp.]|nr:transglycosylase, family [Nocardioides sp.]
MDPLSAPTPQVPPRAAAIGVLVAVLAVGGVVGTRVLDGEPIDKAVQPVVGTAPPSGATAPPVPGAPEPSPTTPTGATESDLAARAQALIESGGVPQRRRARTGPAVVQLATPTSGRVGTGLALGVMDAVLAPVGGPVTGAVTVSVANIPNRTSARGFETSVRTLTAEDQDFVVLNEISARDLASVSAVAPAYAAYRDPVVDRSRGGTQSMNNAVAWRADRWNLVDAGRVKVVDDDRGYRLGRPFVWDRYVTWTVLQRIEDGAVVSVLSTHMPTNPSRFPEQPGGGESRLQRYSRGMDRVVATVRALSTLGPVLLGGDMNSHPHQGSWTAAQKMTAAGYAYVKDRAVMHLFFPPTVSVLAHREVRVDSDHPAIVTTLDMAGTGPTS